MLSDEEKKAMKTIEELLRSDEPICEYMLKHQEIDAMRSLLHLIKKQSKEIEELSDKLTEKICKGVEEEILEEYRQTIISKDKEIEELKEDNKHQWEERCKLTFELENSTSNDKIKAKIEPVLKQLERKMEEEYNKYGNSREYQDIVDAYNFLQSLLEKE